MLALRIIVGLGLAYTLLMLLAWLFQDRLAFPAPRASLPDPKRVGVENGDKVELVSGDGTKLVGWFLKAVEVGGGQGRMVEVGDDTSTILHHPSHPPQPAAGLLWFYGNGETIAAIWPIVREFQPPGTAVLVLDYPGYGGSGGRATEGSLYAAADAAYAALATRPGVDPQRIYVYGPSLGSAVATHTAARRPVAGLIVEAPLTNAAPLPTHHSRPRPALPRARTPGRSGPAWPRSGGPRRRGCAPRPPRRRRRTWSSARRARSLGAARRAPA